MRRRALLAALGALGVGSEVRAAKRLESAELLLTDLARYAPDVRVARFAHGGHWLHHDQPEVVSRHLIQFLSAASDASGA